MNNSFAVLRSLITYAICVPLAVFLGYLLTDPLALLTPSVSSMLLAVVVMVLVFPFLLRWHYQMLLLSWNAIMVVFFMKGQPDVWLLAVAMSLSISILQMTLNRHIRFIAVPQIIWPMVCLLLVVVITAKFTGGFGLRSMGSDVFGSKRYVYLIGAIAGYFALTAQRIPAVQARLFVKLYFIGGITAMVGDLFSYVSPSLYFIFWIFPPNSTHGEVEFGTTRLGGIAAAATAVCYLMMVTYGIRRIFEPRKSWRLLVFAAAFILGMMGGFRSSLIFFLMVFVVQFYLEGLHRTRLLPGLFIAAVTALVILTPFATRLPFTMQRALSFLPIHFDSMAEQDADGTMDWRIHMWEALLPQVPRYLLLGKGYGLSPQDLDVATSSISYSTGGFEENLWASITGDYHNGPLSVILTFGIWGAITFTWLIAAGVRLLYYNYRYSPPELRTINAFLFAYFLARLGLFVFVFGSLNGDMAQFAGLLGLSVSLNGGMRSRIAAPAVNPPREARFGSVMPRPRTAFQQ